MKVNLKLWKELKNKAYKRFMEDVEIGYADPDILDLILTFFKREFSFTTSSCSGRITIVDSPLPWKRKNSTIIFKKHTPITLNDIEFIFSDKPVSRFWLIVTGPIIHVNSAKLSEAKTILMLARKAGFKHSGILSMSEKGIITELRTGIRIAQLIKNDKYCLSSEDLNHLISIFNEALIKGKERLRKLKELLMTK